MAKNIEYYDRMAKDLYNTAYSDGYKDGVKRGKEQYGQHSRGVAHCTRATEEQRETWGRELRGWCDCGKAIEGRWVGLANFCPWCGRVMEWKKDGDTN